MTNTKTNTKAMEKLAAMGITMECVSSDKMQDLKMSCTANTNIKIIPVTVEKWIVKNTTTNTDLHEIGANDRAVKKANKDFVRDANKALKTIKDNVNAKKAISNKLISEIKRCTTDDEIKTYQKKFLQAFQTVVQSEYISEKSNKKNSIEELTDKKTRLENKIADLDKKIKSADSVIMQLTKTDNEKINYSLIDNKLDVIGIHLTDYSLDEIKAVKSQMQNTLHSALNELDNTNSKITELKNLEQFYAKIKNGNEIVINITTASYVNNVNFGVVVGYECNNSNSTYALLHIRALTEKTLKSININEYYADINYNIFENNNTVLPFARQIAKRQSFNMIQRQGSKTQYQIYYACMRNDFTDHDTADILSVAYTQILTCLSVKNPTILLKVKNVLSALNSKIQHLHYAIDIDKIKKYVFAANNFLKYEINYTDILATRDYNTNKRLITLLENMYNAVKDKNITALKTSVYNAVNEYLTSIRSIRENDKMTLNLDDYINRMSNADYNSDNETLATNPYADNDNAEIKRKILFECYKNVKKCINNSTAKTFDLMCKGYTAIQIAEKRKVQKSTISEHISEIKKAFMQSYITLTKSDNAEIKQAFENNVIVFDPSVFDDCKAISEKTEKIIDTYNKNIEFDRIKNAVGEMSAVKYADMQNTFITFVKSGLRDIDIQIFSLLNNNTSVRDTAEKLSINMNVVKRTRIKIINKTLDIIEKYAEITINKDSLKKVEFSTIIELIKTA